MVLHSNQNHKIYLNEILHTESSLTWLESETKVKRKEEKDDPKSNSVQER